MKVEYRIFGSTHTSTAYLNDNPEPDGSYKGTNKHTDDPVCVLWLSNQWVEVKAGDFGFF